MPDGHLRKILWGAKIAKSHPTVSYEDTMDESDQGLYKWLSNIVRDTEDGKCATDDCIGPVWVLPRFWSSRHSRSNGRVVEAHWIHSRNTMQVYHLPFLVCDIERLIADGKFWEFTADLSKGDTAYTTMALGAHTDNTYFVRVSYIWEVL